MTVITKDILGKAINAFEQMDLRKREELTDEIRTHQPQLLASVLALRRLGASFEQLEIPLNILLVCYQSLKTSGQVWPEITEAVQEKSLKRIVGQMGFIEGLTAKQVAQSTSGYVAEHKEPILLAFAFGELMSHDLIRITTETQKFLVLATLNLVECIAETDALADDSGRIGAT